MRYRRTSVATRAFLPRTRVPRYKGHHPNQRNSSLTLQFADGPSAPALRFPDSVVMLIFSNNSKLPAGFGVALMGLTPSKGFAAVDDA